MIEYFDERPEMHHEIGALDYMRFTGAPYLASIHSKLKSHKDNERVHITDEERDKWNRKVDKTTFYELENKVLTKAEKKEIPLRLSQLQNDVPYLTAADVNSKLNADNYITKGDLDSKGYITSSDLNRYATKDYVDNRGYLTSSQAAGLYVTQAQFTAAITALTPGGSQDSSITERIVREWIDEAYADVEEDIKNEVLNSSELENKITLIAGEKIEAEGGMTQAQIAALQLASDRAALLVETINGNEVIKSAGIVAAINANNDSAVKINADHIILDGNTVASAIESTTLSINNGNSQFNSDGSGYIGNGGISWNAQGEFTSIPRYTQSDYMSIHTAEIDGCTTNTLYIPVNDVSQPGMQQEATGMYLYNGQYRYNVVVTSDGTLKADLSNPILIESNG